MAKLLEQQDAPKGSDSVSRKDLLQLMKDEFSAQESRLQAVSLSRKLSLPRLILRRHFILRYLRLCLHIPHRIFRSERFMLPFDYLLIMRTRQVKGLRKRSWSLSKRNP